MQAAALLRAWEGEREAERGRNKIQRERERECQTEHTHPGVSKANFQEESRPDATRGRQPLFIYFCLSGCQ